MGRSGGAGEGAVPTNGDSSQLFSRQRRQSSVFSMKEVAIAARPWGDRFLPQ